MKQLYKFVFLFIISVQLYSQNSTLSGVLLDYETNLPLVGATIKTGNQGVITDLDGKYEISMPSGNYTFNFSYLGYDAIDLVINLNESTIKDLKLNPQIMKEVLVTADIAVDRKTPVAFSNIPTLKLKEELASQDIPMILNSTPGAYATQSGGGDGDARVTIRGFNQRNVAVMLDGIPVNDMENGAVFWSNWFGLNLVTKTMQVQRGLGSSKLAVPSIGGTINIITKGIDSKAGYSVKQELGNNGYAQTTIGVSTGRLKGGWGISLASAYKTNDGWVDGNYSKALFYFLRIDKEIGKHLITLSGFGGPQEHGQRSFTSSIWQWDADFARSQGIADSVIFRSSINNKGLQYNSHWGYSDSARTIKQNSRVNYYHKPQFSLRHSWTISPKAFLSNVVYLSIGNGGGTAPEGSFPPDSTGQIDLYRVKKLNNSFLSNNPSIIRASVNNHFWYGLLSTMKYNINKNISTTFGVDLRSYEGEHYRTVYDLLDSKKGFLGSRNARIPQSQTRLNIGDKYFNNYNGFVKWAGVFGVIEYSKNKLSTFVNLSSAYSAYKYEDYMSAKVLEINGKKYYTSYWDTKSSSKPAFENRLAIVDGTAYTVDNPGVETIKEIEKRGLKIDSISAKNQTIGWLNIPSFTLKTGVNYQLDTKNSIFINIGYLNKATRFNNSIYAGYQVAKDLNVIREATNRDNEIIKAIEVGYSYRSKSFSSNINSYYTNWKNRPFDFLPSVLSDPTDPNSDLVPANVNGLGARHIGLEFDAAYNITQKWKVEGLVSLADWIWNSEALLTNPDGSTTTFDPIGVHVGDAAQLQLGGMVRFEPIKRLYFSTRGTYFGKNYSNIDPIDLTGTNARRESWQMPNYFLFDANAGYGFKTNKILIDIRLNVINVLNTTYISDATNNGVNNAFNAFDAKSANVFFGQGRRWVASLEISF
jgi:iron complex outermembrane recepter protein